MTLSRKVVSTSVKRRPPRAGLGRPKGVPNKITRSVRDAVQWVFEDLQTAVTPRGKPHPARLSEFARRKPTEFYRMAAKLIPARIEGEVKVTLEQLIAAAEKKE